jgi:hypothetical protein
MISVFDIAWLVAALVAFTIGALAPVWSDNDRE